MFIFFSLHFLATHALHARASLAAASSNSSDSDDAQHRLMERFGFSVVQANAILAMRLRRLTGLEREELETEYRGLLKEIERLQMILSSQRTILAEVRRDVMQPGQMSFVRQMAPLGLGHAVWCARDIIGDEPFAVMLPDMLMAAETPALAQAVAAYDKVGGNIVVVEPAPEGETHKYGIVALDGQDGRLNRMTGMVEKPPLGTEPSNLFISGRYILQPELFQIPAGLPRPGI